MKIGSSVGGTEVVDSAPPEYANRFPDPLIPIVIPTVISLTSLNRPSPGERRLKLVLLSPPILIVPPPISLANNGTLPSPLR